jgi:hypothetical protein
MLLVSDTAKHELSRNEYHSYTRIVIVYVYFNISLDQKTVC